MRQTSQSVWDKEIQMKFQSKPSSTGLAHAAEADALPRPSIEECVFACVRPLGAQVTQVGSTAPYMQRDNSIQGIHQRQRQ